jgi:hypothetical protein
MEATATRRDGGPGPSSSRWTYKRHEQISSAGSYTRSSRSGTILSTAYTFGASRPSLSTDFDFELKLHGYDEHLSWGERMKMKRIIELVNSGVKGWFTELDVAWVLDLPRFPMMHMYGKSSELVVLGASSPSVL